MRGAAQTFPSAVDPGFELRDAGAVDTHGRGWLVDIAVGGLAGLIVGLIVAVNVAISTGIEGGYEATIGDVFRENIFVGLLATTIVLAGPVGGVYFLRMLRRKRSSRTPI